MRLREHRLSLLQPHDERSDEGMSQLINYRNYINSFKTNANAVFVRARDLPSLFLSKSFANIMRNVFHFRLTHHFLKRKPSFLALRAAIVFVILEKSSLLLHLKCR